MRRFPAATYDNQRLEFYPAPAKAPELPFAALVFAFFDDRAVLGDIVGRGWCVPSGRLEPGETTSDAARREAREEVGAELGELHYIGYYRIGEQPHARWADCFAARVVRLDAIGKPLESRARREVALDQLPTLYHEWNDLLPQVFGHALDELTRKEPPQLA